MTLQVKVHKTQLANEQTNELTIGPYLGMLVFLDCYSIDSSSFSFLLFSVWRISNSHVQVLAGTSMYPFPCMYTHCCNTLDPTYIQYILSNPQNSLQISLQISS